MPSLQWRKLSLAHLAAEGLERHVAREPQEQQWAVSDTLQGSDSLVTWPAEPYEAMTFLLTPVASSYDPSFGMTRADGTARMGPVGVRRSITHNHQSALTAGKGRRRREE